jgi:exosortase A
MDLSTKKKLLPFCGILFLLVGISLFNIPILQTLWRHSFDDGTYSHAYLIPFISIYLYYLLSIEGKLNYRKKISIPFTLLLATSCYLLFITSHAQISIGYWFSLLLVCISSILMLYRFTWKVVFPTAFLVFILPFWGILVPFLQDLSVISVTYIMSFTGIPTYVEAQTITIPAGVFEIAGGCSGLRYLLVSLAVSSMFIFLHINNIKNAAMFTIIAILGALLTNWIRIALLIVIGEYTSMQSSLMADHNMFGWYLYVPFMFALFIWGNKLADIDLSNNLLDNSEVTTNLIPSKKISLLLIISILLSSTSINTKSGFFSEDITSKTINTTIFPLVYYSSKIEKVQIDKVNSENIYNIFHFNGNDLDGKPTFYGNKLIPEGWKIVEQKTKQSEQLFIVSNNKSKAIISVSFEINGTFYSTKHAFKVARIKSALKGIKKSKLHWKLEYCTNSCRIN